MLVFQESDYIDGSAIGKSRGHFAFHLRQGDDLYVVEIRHKRAILNRICNPTGTLAFRESIVDFAMDDSLVQRAKAELRAAGK